MPHGQPTGARSVKTAAGSMIIGGFCCLRLPSFNGQGLGSVFTLHCRRDVRQRVQPTHKVPSLGPRKNLNHLGYMEHKVLTIRTQALQVSELQLGRIPDAYLVVPYR